MSMFNLFRFLKSWYFYLWVFFILLVQLVIFLFLYKYIKQNYIELTKEISRSEEVNISFRNIDTNNYSKKITFTSHSEDDTNYLYNWDYWYIYSWYFFSWNIMNYKTKDIFSINIDFEKYVWDYYYIYLLEEWIIDIYIYDYFKDKDIQEIKKFLDNLSLVSDYLSIDFHEKMFEDYDNHIEQFKNTIKNKDYELVRDILENIEEKYESLYTEEKYKKNIIKLEFFDDNEFKHIYNILFVDDKNRYKYYINEVCQNLWISKNILYASIFVEQLRWFYTFRWFAKQAIKDNNYIMNMSQFSYWIWWIKEKAARNIEKDLQTYNYDYFVEKFKYVWTNSNYISDRLINNVKYQILYSWALIYNIIKRWESAWYPINDNPWIIFTLYNFWNPKDKIPHDNPNIWGSVIKINDMEYTFWALWMIIFYYLEIYF